MESLPEASAFAAQGVVVRGECVPVGASGAHLLRKRYLEHPTKHFVRGGWGSRGCSRALHVEPGAKWLQISALERLKALDRALHAHKTRPTPPFLPFA